MSQRRIFAGPRTKDVIRYQYDSESAHEIRQALLQSSGPVRIEDDETHKFYVVVDEQTHQQAMQALKMQQDDIAAIQAGIEDMEAGRYRPLEDVDAELRKKHDIPRAT